MYRRKYVCQSTSKIALGSCREPPMLVWQSEMEALLKLNDPGKYTVLPLDIGQPHGCTHGDGLKRDSFPLSYNPGLGCHFGPHGHIVMLAQRGFDHNQMGSLDEVHCDDVAMNPIGPPVGCLTIYRNSGQHHQCSNCKSCSPRLTHPGHRVIPSGRLAHARTDSNRMEKSCKVAGGRSTILLTGPIRLSKMPMYCLVGSNDQPAGSTPQLTRSNHHI